MANCNSVKIRKTKLYKKPTAGNLAHNSAMTKATYWLNDGKDIIQSHKYTTHQQLNEDWNKWIDEAKQRYKNNPNNKNALRSDAVIIEEGMIVIGTDVKATDEIIESIIKDYIEHFEKDNNTKIRHWSYHNHEGHINPSGEEEINRHVHFLFDNVSNDGQMIRRNLPKSFFKEQQDVIYEVSKKYITDIERAKESEYTEVEIEGRKVKINKRKHQHHRTWRKEKELETQKNKQLDQEIEQIKANQDLAKQKDLKEEIAKLRIELKENAAVREDYAKLEQLNKELKELIKDKNLTIEELQNKLKELEFSMTSINKKDNNTHATHITQVNNTQLTSYEVVRDNGIVNLEDYDTILEENKELKNNNYKVQNELNLLDGQKNILELKVVELEEKINSYQSTENLEIVSFKYNDLLNNLENLGTNLNANAETPKGLINWIKSKWKEFKERIVYLENKVFNLEKENEQLRMKIEQPIKISKNIEERVHVSEKTLKRISSLNISKEDDENTLNLSRKARKKYE
ncbi:hypothetical protein [Halarcobacter anaerophilus]|uniref:hypothetical protein n=1 Tax=Halarcobacter anaerophilus TaxID=877500 RepID=UPI0005C86154|nr:hypothetical protein [Halarcobacter anaerophilus]